MPIARPGGDDDQILGFVMGHGALILEEKDFLEMERFLTEVGRELTPMLDSDASQEPEVLYEQERVLTIPQISRVQAVNLVLSAVTPHLAEEDDASWIRLALEEAITNAVVHGHGEYPERPQRTVRVGYAVGASRLVLTVEDGGEGFDHRNVPDPTADENLLNINGRGIFLMRAIMDEVIYNDRGNRVSLVKRLEGRPLRPFSGSEPEGRLRN
jgi:serine/threonine-protein kinase RsbW